MQQNAGAQAPILGTDEFVVDPGTDIFLKILRTTHIELCKSSKQFGIYSLGSRKPSGISAHLEALPLYSTILQMSESSPHLLLPLPKPLLLSPVFSSKHRQFFICNLV